MMRELINANETIRETDHETIQAAVRLACQEGSRKVVVPRYNARTKGTVWSLNKAIELPSDFTLILDNCYMEQARGSFENLITNERSHDLPYSDLWENEARNITVLGEGNVTLSGGVHNHVLEKTNQRYGLPSMFHQPILFWHNVKGLRVENIHFERFRWWSILHVMVSDVVLRNLNFYAIPHVPNLDGIDLRIGCHNFFIENITGRTGDDTLALTGLAGRGERSYAVGGKDTNIHGIKVRNLKSDSNTCYIVRLLNHDGCQEYDIDMDVIMDASDSKSKVRNHGAVAVGSPYYFAHFLADLEDTRKLHFSNVYSRGDGALALNHVIRDSCFENIHTFSDSPALIHSFVEGCRFENVVVKHAYYDHNDPEHPETQKEDYVGTIVTVPVLQGKLEIRDLEAGPVRMAVSAPKGEGMLVMENAKIEDAAEPDELGESVRFVKE